MSWVMNLHNLCKLVGHVQILIRLARLHLNAMEKGEDSGLTVLDIATLIDVACILLTGLNDFMGTVGLR